MKSLLEIISEQLENSAKVAKETELPLAEQNFVAPGLIDNKIELAHLYNEFRLSEQRVANGTLNEMEPGARYIRDLNIRKIEIIREKFDSKFKDLLGVQDISEIEDLDEAFAALEEAGKSKKERIQMALGAHYAAKRAMKEEAEQIDELKVSTYVAAARERGDTYSGKSDPEKYNSIVARASKKFGPKIGKQIADTQNTKDDRTTKKFYRGTDNLADPFPSNYSGSRITKAGTLNRTAAKVLKQQIKNRLREEAEQIDEAVKVGPANHHKSTDTVWHSVHHNGEEIGTIGTHSAQHVEKHGKWGFEDSRGYGRRNGQPALNSKEEALDALVNRHKEYAKKKANEEVEQIDEAKDGDVRTVYHIYKDGYNTGISYTHKDPAKALKSANSYIHNNANILDPSRFKVVKGRGTKVRGGIKMHNEEVEQIDEEFVIHKGKSAPGRTSSLGGQTLHGVTVKDVYDDKREAQAHADALNRGRGYKPEDERNPLYGGVLYQVSPRKSMKEEVEQIDEVSPFSTVGRLMMQAKLAHRVKKEGPRLVKQMGNLEKYRGADGKPDLNAIAKADPKTIENIKKGTDSMARNMKVLGRLTRDQFPAASKHFKTQSGMLKSNSTKLAKEVEQVDETYDQQITNFTPKERRAWGKLLKGYSAKDGHKLMYKPGEGQKVVKTPAEQEKHKALGWKTRTSISHAQRMLRKTLAKEEVEQIDELKKSTLASYIGKAADRAAASSRLQKDFERDGQYELAADFEQSSKKRRANIRRAARKLATEGKVAVTPREKKLAAHHGDPNRITFGDVIKARIKSGKSK